MSVIAFFVTVILLLVLFDYRRRHPEQFATSDDEPSSHTTSIKSQTETLERRDSAAPRTSESQPINDAREDNGVLTSLPTRANTACRSRVTSVPFPGLPPVPQRYRSMPARKALPLSTPKPKPNHECELSMKEVVPGFSFNTPPSQQPLPTFSLNDRSTPKRSTGQLLASSVPSIPQVIPAGLPEASQGPSAKGFAVRHANAASASSHIIYAVDEQTRIGRATKIGVGQQRAKKIEFGQQHRWTAPSNSGRKMRKAFARFGRQLAELDPSSDSESAPVPRTTFPEHNAYNPSASEQSTFPTTTAPKPVPVPHTEKPDKSSMRSRLKQVSDVFGLNKEVRASTSLEHGQPKPCDGDGAGNTFNFSAQPQTQMEAKTQKASWRSNWSLSGRNRERSERKSVFDIEFQGEREEPKDGEGGAGRGSAKRQKRD